MDPPVVRFTVIKTTIAATPTGAPGGKLIHAFSLLCQVCYAFVRKIKIKNKEESCAQCLSVQEPVTALDKSQVP